jgi:hypothetical protein
MKAVAQRIVWLNGLLCLIFGVAGVIAFSPVTVALAVTGWFLSRASLEYLSHAPDIVASTPDLQYWARDLVLRAVGLMALGVSVAFGLVALGVSFHFSVHTQALLTVLLISSMVVVTRLTLPGFFQASWEVHFARDRRQKTRESTVLSRFIVRSVAAMFVMTSFVGTFAFLQAIRLGAPMQYRKMATMAHLASTGGQETIEQMFSPTDGSSR